MTTVVRLEKTILRSGNLYLIKNRTDYPILAWPAKEAKEYYTTSGSLYKLTHVRLNNNSCVLFLRTEYYDDNRWSLETNTNVSPEFVIYLFDNQILASIKRDVILEEIK